MERYSNSSRDSGVRYFEIGPDFIWVKFADNMKYLYTYSSAGEANVETMKRLALRGHGLNSFITKTVKNRYARKTI